MPQPAGLPGGTFISSDQVERNYSLPLVFISSSAMLLMMRLAVPCIALVALLLPALGKTQDKADADVSETGAAAADALPDTPYASVIARNMFGLLPIPPPQPTTPPVEVEPPPKIILNGIMTIFGREQALFKVANKPKPGQPPKEDAFVLAEGEMQNEITVLNIDHVNGKVTFDNHGTTQELELKAASNSSGPAPTLGGGGGGLASAHTPLSGAERLAAIRARAEARANSAGLANPSAANPAAALSPTFGTPAPAAAGMAVSGGTVNANGVFQPQNDTTLTPEQNVLLIEAQRMKMMQQGSAHANLLPPTPLTEQNIRETIGTPQ